MGGINKIENMFEQLESLQAKYQDYRVVPHTEIVYHDPETPEQEAKAKKVANQIMSSYYLFSAIFVGTFIITILTTKKIGVILLMLALCVIIVGATLKNKFKKIQIVTGKVIYKQRKRKSSSSVHKSYDYYVSIIPDGGEKIIYKNIQISRYDYEHVTEESPVMIVNKGTRACSM